MREEVPTYKKIMAGIGVFLFISPNLNILESIFTYCGIESHDIVRIISIIIFAVIDVILAFMFLKAKPSLKMYLILIIFNAIYILPQVINHDGTAMMQYCLFIAPITLFAIMLSKDYDIKNLFMRYMGFAAKLIILVAIIYILLLYFGTNRDEKGMLIIENMTYGDMAYLFVPGFIITIIEMVEKNKIINFAGIVILSVALVFAGARSAILCAVCGIILYWGLLLLGKAPNEKHIRMLIVTLLTLASMFGGMFILPDGSRFEVLDIEVDATDLSENIIFERKEYNSKAVNVIYAPTGEERKLRDIYIDEILNNDRPKAETEYYLRKDVADNNQEYIILIDEADREAAEVYHIRMNRDYLWAAAIAEFKKSPLIGNGALYYKNKYDKFFPHNIFLEAMVDFGVVGLIILTALGIYCFVRGLKYYFKEKDTMLLQLIVLLYSLLPSYVLYTTMYSNAYLAVTIILFTTLGRLNNNGQKN